MDSVTMRLVSACAVLSFGAMAYVPARAADRSCSDEIGKQQAAVLVKQCLDISPATHPPCNAANACQMIRDEIDRGCKLAAGESGTNAASVPQFCTASAAPAGENRCGWFVNPTPANAWLTDRDGEWIVGAQGGHQADGNWPDFGKGQWVKTNGDYGYGCACMKVVANAKTHEVDRILSAKTKPLSACKGDKTLKSPEG